MNLFFIANVSIPEKRLLRMSKVIHMDYELRGECGILVPEYQIPNLLAVAPHLVGKPIYTGFDWLWKLNRGEGFEIQVVVSRWPNTHVGRWLYATQMELAPVLGNRQVELRYKNKKPNAQLNNDDFYIFVNGAPSGSVYAPTSREYWGLASPTSEREMLVSRQEGEKRIFSSEGHLIACLRENALYIFPDIVSSSSANPVGGVAIYRRILREVANLLTEESEGDRFAQGEGETQFPTLPRGGFADRALDVATSHIRQVVERSRITATTNYELATLHAISIRGIARAKALHEECADLLSPEQGGRKACTHRQIAARLMKDPRIENLVVQPGFVQFSTADLKMKDLKTGQRYRLGEVAIRYVSLRGRTPQERLRTDYSVRAWNLSEVVRFERASYSHPYIIQDRETDLRGPYANNVRNILRETATRGMLEAAIQVKLAFLQLIDSSFDSTGAPFRCWRRLE